VDVVSVGGGAAHETLDKAECAYENGEEVGVTELEADVDAR
jgi:hypothetical protein